MKQVKYIGTADIARVELDGKPYEFTREGHTEVTNAAADELVAHADPRFEVYEEDGSTPYVADDGEGQEPLFDDEDSDEA